MKAMRGMTRARWLWAAVAGFLALAAALPALAEEAPVPGGPKRVLVLHSFGEHFQPFADVATAFRSELALQSPDEIELLDIALGVVRFEEGEADKPLVDYVYSLRTQRPVDLIVTVGSPAFRFCMRHRDRLVADVPLVVAGIDCRHLQGVELGQNITAVCVNIDLHGLVDDILQLLPGTANVSVVLGSSPLETYWAGESRGAWQGYTDRIAFTWFNGLTLPQMRERVASLPPHSAIVFALLDVDAVGVPYERNAALHALHDSATAPIFGLFAPELGNGTVGGRLVDVRGAGVESARVAVRILGGESPGAIPPVIVPALPPAFDGRELRRWKIDEARLPPGSSIRFVEPTLWQAYRGRIIAVGALFAAAGSLIVMLLISRARLRSTRAQLGANEQRVRELRRELSLADRVTLLGQFTTSLAHELGQPLGAILRNAEAAELFLEREPPDLEEVRAILADVRKDGERAGGVIDRLRAMLKRHGVESQMLDWSGVVDDVVGIARGNASARGIALKIDTPSDLPPVRGDRVHFQQVLLNLVANAIDAVESAPGGDPRVLVRTRANGNGLVECAVSDTGPGIAPDKLESIFEPFVTTREQGMGMGLPISRTIVETHGGSLWAESNPGRGATFRFTIPVSEPRERHA